MKRNAVQPEQETRCLHSGCNNELHNYLRRKKCFATVCSAHSNYLRLRLRCSACHWIIKWLRRMATAFKPMSSDGECVLERSIVSFASIQLPSLRLPTSDANAVCRNTRTIQHTSSRPNRFACENTSNTTQFNYSC